MPAPTPARTLRSALVAAGLVTALATSACGSPDPGPASTTSDTSSSSAAPSSSPADPTPSESASSSSPSQSPSPTASPSASSSADTGGPFSADEHVSESWPDLGPSVGVGRAIRVGSHDGYDRVVYEFSGKGVPTYRVLYVDEPKDSMTGDVVDAPGDAFLMVRVAKVEMPGENDATPNDPSADRLKGTVITYAPAIWGGLEGYGEQFIGVTGTQRPFRVSTLKNPTRLVVDIRK